MGLNSLQSLKSLGFAASWSWSSKQSVIFTWSKQEKIKNVVKLKSQRSITLLTKKRLLPLFSITQFKIFATILSLDKQNRMCDFWSMGLLTLLTGKYTTSVHSLAFFSLNTKRCLTWLKEWELKCWKRLSLW